MDLENEKETPFQPGYPVDPDKFKGRRDIIENINRYLLKINKGEAQHFFLTGKRGMGKTSLASYINELVKRKYKMIGVHIFNDGFHDVDSLVEQIIERLLNEIVSETWSQKIFDFLEEHIEQVGLLGASIKFNPKDKEYLKSIKDTFPSFLTDLIKNSPDKSGIFIIIDDINGLTETPEFANWYKSFTDTMATEFRGKSNVGMMLVGYPEKLNSLFEHNPSFNRIFNHYEVEPLHKNEVSDFFTDTFKRAKIKVNSNVLETMVVFSSGQPTLMQEIGDSVFWEDKDNFISDDDVNKGIIEAGLRIGKKFFEPIIDKSIISPRYKSILEKMGKNAEVHFKKKEFEDSLLDEEETRAFPDFLKKARDLNILETDGIGNYKFLNVMYPLYLLSLSLKNNS
ncbi:MAG: ATP-binding protein [Methanobrevibacter sp.]|nr:ATP-binding protein [Methanobrevibacter sp.]